MHCTGASRQDTRNSRNLCLLLVHYRPKRLRHQCSFTILMHRLTAYVKSLHIPRLIVTSAIVKWWYDKMKAAALCTSINFSALPCSFNETEKLLLPRVARCAYLYACSSLLYAMMVNLRARDPGRYGFLAAASCKQQSTVRSRTTWCNRNAPILARWVAFSCCISSCQPRGFLRFCRQLSMSDLLSSRQLLDHLVKSLGVSP